MKGVLNHFCFLFLGLLLIRTVKTNDAQRQSTKFYLGKKEIIITETPKVKLREDIHDFAFMSYPEMMTTVDTLCTAFMANIETKFNLDTSPVKLHITDVLQLFNEIREVTDFHSRMIQSFPEEMFYYTFKVLSDEDAESIINEIKTMLKENGHDNLKKVNDQYEVFKRLSFANLPSSSFDVAYFFGVLEEYTILGDKLRTNIHPDELEGHLQQVKFISSTFDFFEDCIHIFERYKIDLIPAFFGTYILEWIYKDLETNQDNFALFDLIRMYSVIVQKEVMSANLFIDIAEKRLADIRKQFKRLFKNSIEVFDLEKNVYDSVKSNETFGLPESNSILFTSLAFIFFVLS